MKKLSKKGVLLFAAAMALCAFAMPSMGSAASWGSLTNTDHTLHSPNIGFTSPSAAGDIASSCTSSSFTSNIASTQNLEITTGRFGGLCTATGPGIGTCTATATGTKFPWTATPVATNNIQLHGVHIDITFVNVPGLSPCANLLNQSITITGTLTGGRWTGNASGSRALDFSNAEGLVSHFAALATNNTQITTRGYITDAQNSLIVTG
jgi:hypothetical protein